jgi:hypothetical protein
LAIATVVDRGPAARRVRGRRVVVLALESASESVVPASDWSVEVAGVVIL